MKKLFKPISLLLLALLVVFAIKQPAQAAHEDFSLFDYELKGGQIFTENDYEYVVINEEAYITKASRSFSGHVVVPSQLGGYPVTFIFGGSFRSCVNVTEVTIPDSVITIGFNCFEDCTGLETVNLGKNVTTFIGRAFAGCASLKTVNWGPNVKKIGRENFYDCTSLTSITIPDSVTTIDHSLFYYCENLESVKLSENLTDLPQSTFHSCYSLKSIVIPDSVQSVGRYAFCMSNIYGKESQLESVVIGSGVKSIGLGAFTGSKSLTTVTMNQSVEIIEDSAFEYCEKLQSIVIPDSTVTIEEHAFVGCVSLATVTWGKNIQTIGACAFEDCAITEIILPDTVTEIGVQAFSGCDKATTVKIGNSVEKIDSRAFQYCAMTEILIPDSVTYLGREAFSCCTNAKTLSIGSGVTELNEKAFYHCTSLESASIAAGVVTIGNEVFTDCSSLKAITVAEENPNYSSDECGVLFNKDKTKLIQGPGGITGTYTVPNGVTTIGDHAFYQSKQLTGLAFPDSLKTIEGFAFYGCENIEHIDYGNGLVEAPGSMTFAYCNKLTEVNLPDSFKTIGAHMYRGCEGLVDIVIPDGVETIGTEAFAYISNLKSVKLGKGVKLIKRSAFEFCEHMEKISVFENLQTVEDSAFYRCDDLTDVYYDGTADQWYSITIGNNNENFKYPKNLHVVTPHDHQYKPTVIKPTCTDQGYTQYTCSVCGDSYEEKYVAALGHSGGTATCKNQAQCTRCETPYGELDATNHTGETTVKNAVAASCVADGYTGDTYCAGCDEKLATGTVIPPAHTYAKTTQAPTYTTPGYTIYTCECGDTYTDDEVPALGLPKPNVTIAADSVTGKPVLTWIHVSDADEYAVYRASGKSGKYTKIGTADSSATYTDTSASVGKTYFYKITAVYTADSTLNSSYSSVVSCAVKCAQPDIIAEAGSSGKPQVKWNKVTGAKKYEVYRATSEAGKYSKVTTTTKQTYTDTKATYGKTYFYKVKAIATKSTFNSNYSEVKSCLTVLAQPTLTLNITAATGKPALSWKAVTGAAGYEVYRATAENGTYEKLVEQTARSYSDTAAAPDTDYWYKVKALGADAALNSLDSAAKKIHTTLAKPVVTFKVDDVSGKPTLTWEAVEGAVEYKVYRSTKSTSSYKAVKTTTELSYTDTSASVGKGYYYKVIAIGANAKSAYSSYKKLTAKCAQPVITVEANADGKPVIKWSKVSGAKKYYVYRIDGYGNQTTLGSTTKTSYTDKKAKPGESYTYRIRAYGSKTAYNSIYSETVAFDCE